MKKMILSWKQCERYIYTYIHVFPIVAFYVVWCIVYKSWAYSTRTLYICKTLISLLIKIFVMHQNVPCTLYNNAKRYCVGPAVFTNCWSECSENRKWKKSVALTLITTDLLNFLLYLRQLCNTLYIVKITQIARRTLIIYLRRIVACFVQLL